MSTEVPIAVPTPTDILPTFENQCGYFFIADPEFVKGDTLWCMKVKAKKGIWHPKVISFECFPTPYCKKIGYTAWHTAELQVIHDSAVNLKEPLKWDRTAKINSLCIRSGFLGIFDYDTYPNGDKALIESDYSEEQAREMLHIFGKVLNSKGRQGVICASIMYPSDVPLVFLARQGRDVVAVKIVLINEEERVMDYCD